MPCLPPFKLIHAITLSVLALLSGLVPVHSPLVRFLILNPKQVCVYGKPEGAGTGVTLSNTHFAGLGVPIPFDESTGVCGAVTVRGLTPNESYVSSCRSSIICLQTLLLLGLTVNIMAFSPFPCHRFDVSTHPEGGVLIKRGPENVLKLCRRYRN